jgi:hypothetical protein
VRGRVAVLALAVLALLASAGAAYATFPYPAPTGDPNDYSQYKIPPGANQGPNDLVGDNVWKYAASPEDGNEPTNSNPYELNGVRGAHVVDNKDVEQAWRVTTGRPDVTIATLDSGIKWNELEAMEDLRRKTRLSRGETPTPLHDRTNPLEGSKPCNEYVNEDDANEDGVFNVLDYACDSRVERDPAVRQGQGKPKGVGPADVIDPQDVLIAFTDDDDDDGNGFEDDIVGWDFLDDDNDPYDDVQYGHGTGEAEDSFGEADNGGALAACANCMGIHMRVGDSFIADVNRFAQAVIYAVDNDALVVQEALGTLNNSKLGRDAVEYAYEHGVTVVASAADEAAQHHNWPSSYPHVLMVNSVIKYPNTVPPGPGRSYLHFNGCTNFMANVTLAIPSTSCSSDATGRASGMAGLVYSAALNAHERASDPLPNHPTCERANGDPCVISANEVRQVMASGTVDPSGAPPKEQTSDDVDFLSTPKGGSEPSCNPPAPGCTDPNNPGLLTQSALHRPLSPAHPPPNSRSYLARKGHDQFYGYGRVNTNRAVKTVDAKRLPPEVEITSPEWWDQIDPARDTFEVRGQLLAREGTYTCEVFVAPGSYPNNDTGSSGDFKKVDSDWCDGSTGRGPFSGKLADVSLSQLKALFPSDVQGFDKRESGSLGQTSNGRPNTEPYGFVVKVVASATAGGAAVTGEDRRNAYLHRDQDMLDGFPRRFTSDGAASPLLVDLDGDNRNELVLATSDGDVHAYRRDGSELPGWPVRSDPLPIHQGRRDFEAHGAFLASPAAGDLDHDGAPEVVAADLEGKLYAWNEAGERLFARETEIKYSGKPLSPFEDVRRGHKYRTQHGFIASPVLADLDRDDGGKLEIVAAAMDRHVYAWHHDGSGVDGYPTIVIDFGKLQAGTPVDPTTHAPNFRPDIGDLNQGAIIDTPAVGDLAGDERPEIVVGTNEEYKPGEGGEPPPDFQATSAFTPLSAILDPVNSRLYALKPEGDSDGPNSGAPPYLSGWPSRIAFLLAQVLPIVGEGITGAPIIGPVDCPEGGEGPKVGAVSAAGPGYVLNPDGSSCYGEEGGRKRTLATEGAASPRATDQPSIPAFGHPAFADLGDGMSFFVPAAGLIRALDAAATEYQIGGQDQLSGWDAQSRNYRPNWPVQMNDLQFLTGPSISDLDGEEGEELVAGSASLDLQAYDKEGLPLDDKWPKLTSDWTVANPAVGSFGSFDVEEHARKAVVAITRSGLLLAYRTEAPACTPASWPRFHHDNANSGDYRRDAVSPGRPYDELVDGASLYFRAPGDDLMCGKAREYEYVHSDSPITRRNFEEAEPLGGAPEPDEPGTRQTASLAGSKRYVALRARDDQGNVGRPIVVDRAAQPGFGGGGGPGGTQGIGSRCTRPTGRLRGRRLGPVGLGQRRASVRRLRGARRMRRRMDRVCLTDGRSIRVGYSSSRSRGRATLLLTTSRRYRALGLRPGSRVRRLRGAARFRVGSNTWHLRRGRRATAVLRVRGGRVREIGIASRARTRGRRAAARFLRSF